MSAIEAKERLKKFGYNELKEAKKISPFEIFVAQFKNVLILILLAAVAISASIGEAADAAVIFIIVFFAAVLGFVQEYKAERAMEALKKLAAPTARVLRGGWEAGIPAREVVPGDVVLLDDNFASIVAAVEEGRVVFENIKKYLMYLLSSNLGEVLLMSAAILAGLPLPLIAIQILYVNLATDGLPAIALSVDPPEPDIMRRPPRNPRQGIFTRPVVGLIGIGGVWSAGVNLGIFLSLSSLSSSSRHSTTAQTGFRYSK